MSPPCRAATRLEFCLLLPRAHCTTLTSLYPLHPDSVSLGGHHGLGDFEGTPNSD